MRLRRAAIGLSVSVLVSGFLGGTAAAQEQPVTETAPLPAAAGPASQPDSGLPDTGPQCKEVNSSLAREKGRTMRACIERTQPVRTLSAAAVPSWCDGEWDSKREESCYVANFDVWWYYEGTDDEAGRAHLELRQHIDLNQSATSWTDTLDLTVARVSGDIDNDDLLVNYEATCRSSNCSMDDSWPAQVSMAPGSTKTAAAKASMTPADGWYMGDMVDYELTFDLETDGPGEWAEELTYSWNSGTIRCDNALPGNALPGCVHSYITPTYDTASWPELADHVRDAQAAGAKGGTSTLEPLHRLIDPYWQNQNRNTACPQSLPRPEGKSCDEYPMASTYEGAATGGDGNVWSRRMIDENHNSGGGRALGTFYRDKRIIDSDQFWVAT